MKEVKAIAEIIDAPPQKEEAPTVVTEPPRANKTLCVGTVFMNDDQLQRQWYDLQMRFIRATTKHSYDHVVYCSDVKTSTFKNGGSTLISDPDGKRLRQSSAHSFGLNSLLKYFQSVRQHYDYFLFIDSDAFPCRKGWLDVLTPRLKKHEIAIALRPENLEQRLHSSILLARRSALDHLSFQVAGQNMNDLAGGHENDLTCPVYQVERRTKAFPLLRSNQKELHPLLCGIYYDLFYHNGCGTGRNFNMRARGYWGHMTTQQPPIEKWMEQLFASPGQFIRDLAGWNPKEYPEV